MAQVPSGTLNFVASKISQPIPVTGVSNAEEAVVTAPGHGFEDGDIVLLNSGWGRLNKRCFRVKDADDDTFALENADTTRTDFFPDGTGGGSVTRIEDWIQIVTVMNPSTSGGEAKKVTYKFLESDVEYNINDGFSAISRTYELDADSFDAPGYKALERLTETQEDTVLKMLLRNGSAVYLPCTVALSAEPQIQEGKIVTSKLEISGNGRSTRYSAL